VRGGNGSGPLPGCALTTNRAPFLIRTGRWLQAGWTVIGGRATLIARGRTRRLHVVQNTRIRTVAHIRITQCGSKVGCCDKNGAPSPRRQHLGFLANHKSRLLRSVGDNVWNIARPLALRIMISDYTNDDWAVFYRGCFKEQLKLLPTVYPCPHDCSHCRAPSQIRVLISPHEVQSQVLNDHLSEYFICCWYGLILESQTIFTHFPNVRHLWSAGDVTPLPVVECGFGCVRVAPPKYLLNRRRVSMAVWHSFLPFLIDVMLREVTELTGVALTDFLEKIRKDSNFQNGREHPLERMMLEFMSRKCT